MKRTHTFPKFPRFPLTYTSEQIMAGETSKDPRVEASVLQHRRRQGFGVYFGLSDDSGSHVIMHQTATFKLVDKWAEGISMPRQFSLQVRDKHDNHLSISLSAYQVEQLKRELG